jgi:hypothetical protein
MDTRSPNRQEKLMADVFWDRKGVLMVKLMQKRTTITSEA